MQDRLIRFCDRNNDPFDWTNEQELLIEGNAPESDPAVFPDVPKEIAGVVLESNTPAMEEEATPTEEEQSAVTADYAGITSEFEEF